MYQLNGQNISIDREIIVNNVRYPHPRDPALREQLGVTDRCLADRDVCELLLGVDLDTRLGREVLELDVFFGHSFALSLLFALEHFLVNGVDLVAHLSSLSHAFHAM